MKVVMLVYHNFPALDELHACKSSPSRAVCCEQPNADLIEEVSSVLLVLMLLVCHALLHLYHTVQCTPYVKCFKENGIVWVMCMHRIMPMPQ